MDFDDQSVIFQQDQFVHNDEHIDYRAEDEYSNNTLKMIGNNDVDVDYGHEAAVVFRSENDKDISSDSGKTTIRRRRAKRRVKNEEEVENRRRIHIDVERNRRKQINHFLSLIRSTIPSSYVQRGDQASIVGGAINYVKELEQLVQSLETQNLGTTIINEQSSTKVCSDFFVHPQYSTSTADVEVTMVESHASIKVMLKRRQKQLMKIVSGLQFLGLVVLHLNLTALHHHMVLYSISVKVEDDFQLTSVNDIATSVYEMVVRIQEERMI